MVGGLLCAAAGFAWLAAAGGASYPALVPGMVLAGVGVSAAMPAAQNAAVGAVAREAIGTASGVYNALRQVGSTFGVAIASVVFAASGSFASPLAVTRGYQGALAVAAGISAAGALAGAGLRARRPVTSPPIALRVPVSPR